MNNWKSISLPIKSLRLWDENARFSERYFNQPEEELIKHFLSKKNFKIVKLAEEIVKDFDLPQLEKIVVYRLIDENIVLEGNRRLAVYKLLAEPNLIKDSGLQKKFSELSRKININVNFELECLVTDNLEQGYRYIERKHLNQNNEVGWGDTERAYHKKRRGMAGEKELLKVKITKIIQNLSLPNVLKDKVLGPGYVTTFWRLLEQSPAHKIFGFSFDKQKRLHIEAKDFEKKLVIIIWNVLNKGKFKEKLFSRMGIGEIEEYLKSVSSDDYNRVMEEIEKQKSQDLFGKERISLLPATSKRTKVTKQPDVIFGKKLILQPGPVNNLYRGICAIYEKFGAQDNVLPIIAMSLRLLLDTAARVYFINKGDEKAAAKDDAYKQFLKEAKKQLNKEEENSLVLINEWLSDKRNIEAILAKYAHGTIIYKQGDVLKDSIIVGDIIEHYFKKRLV